MSKAGGIMGLELSGGGYKFKLYTANATWVCPAPNTFVRAIVIGGGGGGGGAVLNYSSPNANGGTGGTSSFGSHVSATGGGPGYGGNGSSYAFSLDSNNVKQRGSAENGSQWGTRSFYLNFKSGNAYPTTIGFLGQGGQGYMGFGGGGNGSAPEYYSASAIYIGGSGGCAGNFAEWEGNVSSNVTVTVGAGGAYGYDSRGGQKGTPGQSGAVLVWWEE